MLKPADITAGMRVYATISVYVRNRGLRIPRGSAWRVEKVEHEPSFKFTVEHVPSGGQRPVRVSFSEAGDFVSEAEYRQMRHLL